jgi:hypothetical protein
MDDRHAVIVESRGRRRTCDSAGETVEARVLSLRDSLESNRSEKKNGTYARRSETLDEFTQRNHGDLGKRDVGRESS